MIYGVWFYIINAIVIWFEVKSKQFLLCDDADDDDDDVADTGNVDASDETDCQDLCNNLILMWDTN